MNTPNNIIENFGTLYHPKTALIFYSTQKTNAPMYVEHFDIDANGHPLNAHPLTIKEAKVLAKALTIKEEKSKAFLKPNGILPTNVLHINPEGTVLWYTKTRKRNLFFTESLEINNGTAEVPALLWYVSKQKLMVFALEKDRRPTSKTALFHAPFLNLYEDGHVCMGTVDVEIKNSASVEEFTQAWEFYFFNSYFSHLVNSHNPIKGNCVSLWKDLISTGKAFPKEVLKTTNRTLKNILP